jgi:Putative Flp pilus-assembly TadE/G-like
MLKEFLLQILSGDEIPKFGSTSLKRCAASEEGLVSWATLLAVFLFCSLIAIVFNAGRIANDKLEAQNAADSAAYSASLVQARSMNAITASNHMIGELMTLYTMHHAIGGKILDDGRSNPSLSVIGLNIGLPLGYGSSLVYWGISHVEPRASRNRPLDFSGVFNIPIGEATVHDAKCMLKWRMIEEYKNHVEGSEMIIEGFALRMFPLTAAAGQALIEGGLAKQELAVSMMKTIKQEYKFLDQLQKFALNTRQIKKQVIPGLIQAIWLYEKAIVGSIPGVSARWKSMDAAKSIAAKNDCIGEVLGRPTPANIASSRIGIPSTVLPLVPDPWKQDQADRWMRLPQKSQLMRATYPCVQEWRAPLLIAFDVVARESRAARFYEYYTDRYVREKVNEFRDDRGIKLMVLLEMDASQPKTDKGNENWRKRDESPYADRLFAVVGVARRKASPAASHLAFFPNTNPEPVAAMAQAMIYNGARPKKWKRDGYDLISLALQRKPQPVEGWDTLNWVEGATEWKMGKWYLHPLGDIFRWTGGKLLFMDVSFYPPDILIPIAGPKPKVELHWQSKLVPIAPRNLALRIPMIRDQGLRDRMSKQVLPGILAHELGAKVINQ